MTSQTLQNSWDVLLLFLIPIGGGIPGGVLLGKARGLAWPVMMVLYLISDMILACVFEPLMLGIIRLTRRSKKWTRFFALMREATQRRIASYGVRPSVLTLVVIAFGVDPMTGRAAAKAAGHGFLSGWLIAITGDMFYFSVIMVCTLWLKEYLGDGTMATLIVLVAMMVLPSFFGRLRILRDGLRRRA